MHRLIDWLTCPLIDFLVDWLIDWLRNSFLLPHLWCSSLVGVNHDQLVKLAEKEFGSVGFNYSGEIPVVEPCRFTGSEVCSDIIAINLHSQFSLVSVSYLLHFFLSPSLDQSSRRRNAAGACGHCRGERRLVASRQHPTHDRKHGMQSKHGTSCCIAHFFPNILPLVFIFRLLEVGIAPMALEK